MKAVPATRLHVARMAVGLRAVIEKRGNRGRNLSAAAVGKKIALGGIAYAGWNRIMTATPSFLSREKRIMRRSYEVTTTAKGLDCLFLVDFIPEVQDA